MKEAILPPVLVVGEHEEELCVELSLPEQRLEERFSWILIQEDGTRHSSQFRAAELRCSATQGASEKNWRRFILPLPEAPRPGYHQLELHSSESTTSPLAAMLLIVTPTTCYQPEALHQGARVWGLAIQLYALRSARNWGIGDFSDLLRVVEFAAQVGAALVSLNPLHALFPQEAQASNPFQPSTRHFLNILYLDVEQIADLKECPSAREAISEESFQARLRALRASEQVDYAAVARCKMEIFQLLYARFRARQLVADTERARAFNRFRAEQGAELQHYVLHEALQDWLSCRDSRLGRWPTWPEPYQHPDSAAVATFQVEHETLITFYAYLQWQAQLQFEAAGQHAYDLGLRVGICLDIAGGVELGGAEVWSRPEQFACQTRTGSPPSGLRPQGQVSAQPPWLMDVLREQAYGPLRSLLRQNMQVSGALRIETISSLLQSFCIPAGRPASEGVWLSGPHSDLLGILALESQRNQCLIIAAESGAGEACADNLGEALRARGIFTQQSFYGAKTLEQKFIAPADFTTRALVSFGAGELPTLAGFWQGLDLELREQLELYDSAEVREQQIIMRAQDRAFLLLALEQEDLMPEGLTTQQVSVPEMTLDLAVAIHRYLARSPAQLMILQLEDILGQSVQVNLPRSFEQSGWRHKLMLDLELWDEDPRFLAFISALRDERSSSVDPPRKPGTLNLAAQTAEIPRCSYRLQLRQGFTFNQACEILPYLNQLGISHCYTSPCLQSRPGSFHGYDIIDHNAFSAELGGAEGFARLIKTLKAQRLGLLFDMVPNHMGIMGRDNLWWLDVLENGPASTYADFFDIDWSPLKSTLSGKILVPVLGDHYGAVLDQGGLQLRFHAKRGAFSVHYFEHEFPLDPREYPRILAQDINRLEKRLGSDNQPLIEFQSLITALGKLPDRAAVSTDLRAERNRDKEVHKGSLSRLAQDADIEHFLNENLELFNSVAGAELLHELLRAQAWRVAYWRVASDEINYRRFFDINDLAGLRMENPTVFEATHRLVFDLIDKGEIQGLRIDHPDGLCNPADYFRRLQARVAAPFSRQVGAVHRQTAKDGSAPESKPLYLLVEKILAAHEQLPEDWAVHGTTGYDFAIAVNGLFVDPAAEAKMDKIYTEFVGKNCMLEESIYSGKKIILRTALASELNVLAQQLSRIAELDRHTCDFTLNSLRECLSEIITAFPVYRTYLQPDRLRQEERRHIEWAVQVAKQRSRAVDVSVYDFVREVLLTEIAEGKNDAYRNRVIAFALKFQQYTGPVMAKGLEDTAFYRYNRLLSLNEVGGDPEQFGRSIAAFHQQNQYRQKHWPHAMLCGSSHDSKRSEDVRARINVLSEQPEVWRAQVRLWARLNHKLRYERDDQQIYPSRLDEYLLYQTLIGVWPLEELDAAGLSALGQRVESYMLKAVREAKLYSSWINPDPEYEGAMLSFVKGLLSHPGPNLFLKNFIPFQRQISRVGMFNSLAQTLLRLTSPGMPDIYQGNELWDFSLVDPDNRRPVDYGRRIAALSALQERLKSGEAPHLLTRHLLQNLADGSAKLYLIWRSLQLRRQHPELFKRGAYQPLRVEGSSAEHVCAFARSYEENIVVTIVPRLVFRLCGSADPLGAKVWGETWITLPEARWINLLTNDHLAADPGSGIWRLPVGRILQDFPVALLWLNRETSPLDYGSA